MDAVFTFKISPEEFDVIRNALDVAQQVHANDANGPQAAARTLNERRASRMKALEISNIREKLGKKP